MIVGAVASLVAFAIDPRAGFWRQFILAATLLAFVWLVAEFVHS